MLQIKYLGTILKRNKNFHVNYLMFSFSSPYQQAVGTGCAPWAYLYSIFRCGHRIRDPAPGCKKYSYYSHHISYISHLIYMNYRYNLTRKFQYLFKIIVKIAINPEINQNFLILVLSSTIFCTGIIGYLYRQSEQDFFYILTIIQ